jgi:hypothetical protein
MLEIHAPTNVAYWHVAATPNKQEISSLPTGQAQTVIDCLTRLPCQVEADRPACFLLSNSRSVLVQIFVNQPCKSRRSPMNGIQNRHNTLSLARHHRGDLGC